MDAGLLVVHRQGRHRYHGLAGADVAELLERLSGVAARTGHRVPVTGPPDPALRRARVCYDHLAGALAVAFFDAARDHGWIETRPGEGERTAAALTPVGAEALRARGIDVDGVLGGRRPPCLACMDWSGRRPHAAGALGSAVLALCLSRRWARRTPGSRTVRFSAAGERAFDATLCRRLAAATIYRASRIVASPEARISTSPASVAASGRSPKTSTPATVAEISCV